MTTRAVFASVVVKIMAKTYPFQANATTNSATETSPWAISSTTTSMNSPVADAVPKSRHLKVSR